MSDQRRNTTEFTWVSDLPGRPDGNTARRVNETQTKPGSSGRRQRPSGSGRSAGTGRRTNSTNRNKRKRKTTKKRRQIPMIYVIIAVVAVVIIAIIAGVLVRKFSKGNKAMKNGVEAFENGYYDQAIRDFKEALSYDSNNKDYLSNLGMAQISYADFDGALETFNRLKDHVRGDEAKELAYRGIGIVKLYTSNYDEAAVALNQAISYAGKQYTDLEIDILYYLAEAQMKNGDPVGAVLSYTQIIDQRDEVTAYMLRGIAYQEVGDHTNAEVDLNKAIEMQGENFKIDMTLYQVLLAEGKDAEAEKLLKRAVALPVNTAEDYSNRGFMYTYIGEEELAMSDFDYAISHDYFAAYFGKATLLMKQGNYEEAKANFDIYFVEFSDNARAYNQYGICMMALGEYDEAIAAFERGIAANDRSLTQELSFNIIVAYEKNGAWAKAEAAINTYLETYPDDEVAQKELRFIKSRQYLTEDDLSNHPEMAETESDAEQAQ